MYIYIYIYMYNTYIRIYIYIYIYTYVHYYWGIRGTYASAPLVPSPFGGQRSLTATRALSFKGD